MSMETIGTGDGSRICSVLQSGWISPPDGALPTAPAWDTLRLESFSLEPNINVEDSKELNYDREFRGTYLKGINVTGSLKAPLIYSEHDQYLLDLLHCSAWSTNKAVIGAARRMRLFEETQELGAADLYKRYVNCEASRGSLTFSDENPAMLEIEYMGSDLRDDTAAIASATYPTQSYGALPATVESISGETWTNLPSGLVPIIKEVKITIDHGLAFRKTWTSPYPIMCRQSRAKVGVSIKCYLDDLKLVRMALDRIAVGLKFRVGLPADKKYEIEMPRIEWVQPRTDPRETDTDTMVTLEGRCNRTSTKSALNITRDVGP